MVPAVLTAGGRMQNKIHSQPILATVFNTSQKISPTDFRNVRICGIDVVNKPIGKGEPDVIKACLSYLLKS